MEHVNTFFSMKFYYSGAYKKRVEYLKSSILLHMLGQFLEIIFQFPTHEIFFMHRQTHVKYFQIKWSLAM